MTTTSQPDSDDGAEGLEPTTQAPESTKDAQGVPVGEFVEMRQELRAARDELEQLKAAQEQSQPASEKPAYTQTSDGSLADAVAELQRQGKVNNLASELSLAPNQAKVVADILDSNPGLDPLEARSIAATRDPDAFAGGSDDGGFDPGTHGMTRPRSVNQDPEPQKSDFQSRTEHVGEVFKNNRAEGARLWNNWVGEFAAKAVGREHKLTPIPKKL